MKTIEKLAKEYKKASDKVYSDRKASKKVWVGHRFSKSYRGAINSKDKLTLEELSASISEATGTDVEEVANAIFYAYNTPFDGDGKYAKITSYTMATTSVVVDLYTFLEVHENPETGEKTLFIDFERAESICNHWSAIYITYNECKKERPWRCVNFKKAQ